jgi:hypothetical protein
MTSATTMPPWCDAPQPACVRAGPRTDRRSAACTARIRRDGGEAQWHRVSRRRGRGNLGKVRGLGLHAASERRGGPDTKAARRAGVRDVAVRRRLARTRFAEPPFEHAKLQNFE